MSKTILIGLLVAVVVIGGAILIVNMNNSNISLQTATSTPIVATSVSPTPNPAQQAGVPIVATDSTAVPSNSTVVLTGKVTPNGAQTSYWYEFGKTNTLGSRTTAQSIGSGFIAISAPTYITGFNANTTYFYRLVAQSALGTATGATYSFETNNNPPPQGNAPTTRTNAATNVSRTSANVNGEANPNGSQTSYWFEYGESAELGNVTAFQSAGAGTASMATSVSLSNLKPLTKYYFRVDAQNQFGTVNGAILNFTTQGPAAPSLTAATTSAASNIATSSATLNGQVNPNGDSTTYWFEYSLNSNLSTLVSGTSHTQVIGSGTASVAVSAQAVGLKNNTKYFYHIVAMNSFGTVNGAIVTFQTRR